MAADRSQIGPTRPFIGGSRSVLDTSARDCFPRPADSLREVAERQPSPVDPGLEPPRRTPRIARPDTRLHETATPDPSLPEIAVLNRNDSTEPLPPPLVSPPLGKAILDSTTHIATASNERHTSGPIECLESANYCQQFQSFATRRRFLIRNSESSIDSTSCRTNRQDLPAGAQQLASEKSK